MSSPFVHTYAQVPSKYEGKSVDMMANVIISACASGEHAVLIGAPGGGKTSIGYELGERMVNNPAEEFLPLFFESSSPPEMVTGGFDPAKFLASPPVYERNISRTPFDLKVKYCFMDEPFRGNDALFDPLLHALERKDVPKDLAPTFIATANFAPQTMRFEACGDRFTYWVWVQDEKTSVKIVGPSQLAALGGKNKMVYAGSVPTWQQIDDVRQMTVPPESAKAILDVLAQLETEIYNFGSNKKEEGTLNLRKYNKRRTGQWNKVLFRTSALYYGSNSFTSVHPEAMAMLPWLWPSQTYDEWSTWNSVCSTPLDPIKKAIDEFMEEAYADFKKDFQPNDPTSSIKLGALLAEKLEGLVRLGGKDDPRVVNAQNILKYAYYDISQGKNPIYNPEEV